MYKSYTHVERLGTPSTEGILNNSEVYVTAKIDGTNGCVWADKTGAIYAGSRKRLLSVEDDNQGFCRWFFESEDPEAINLRAFVKDYPEHIVYGEWLGNFMGNIKDYNPKAKRHFYIFDVYQEQLDHYMSELTWRALLQPYDLEEWYVALLGCLDHPTETDIIQIAKNNTFLLENANHPGEGVVIKCPNWINTYGRMCYGKFVLDEYIQNKKKKKDQVPPGEAERYIVNNYVTESELAKAISKTNEYFKENSFNPADGKMVGFYINIVMRDSVLDECANWTKKLKNPTVDFKVLQNLTFAKAKMYIGLIGRENGQYNY